MRVDCVGIEVIGILKVEIALWVGGEGGDGPCIAIPLGLAERKLAKVPSCRVVSCGLVVLSQEVHGNPCKLQMAPSPQKPDLMVVGD